MTALAERESGTYQPAYIKRWLLNWGDLEALSSSPSTAYGLTRPGPTPETPKVGARQHGYSGDHLEWACLKADIERAALALAYNSIEARTVEALMQGHRLGAIGRANGGYDAVSEALDRASERMAETLGGEPEPVVEAITHGQCAAHGCTNPACQHGRFCSTVCRLRTEADSRKSWRTGIR